MWDIIQIKKQKQYCLKRLSNYNLSEDEKAKLKLTIHSYLYMLDSSGTLCHTLFPKIIDIVSKGKYLLYRENKYENIAVDVDTSGTVKYNELVFLINLLTSLVENEITYEQENFNKIDVRNEELIDVAVKFYKELGDKEISDLALNILRDETNINFTKNMRYKKENIGGHMYMDYIFNKTYSNIYLHKNINDFNSLVHEVMHCVDHSFNQKIPTKYNSAISEISGYASDFLFTDYLDNIEFNKIEVEKLKKQKIYTIYSLINSTFNEIKKNYYLRNKEQIAKYSPIEMIIDSLNPKIIANLIEIKSILVSYGLYLQIKSNEEYGFNNFKIYMKNGKNIDSDLDFGYIGLSNIRLIEITEKFKNYSKSLVDKPAGYNIR